VLWTKSFKRRFWHGHPQTFSSEKKESIFAQSRNPNKTKNCNLSMPEEAIVLPNLAAINKAKEMKN